MDVHYHLLEAILKENLREEIYRFWEMFRDTEVVLDTYDKPVSSSGKYHQKEDGRIPSIAEHTCEMMTAALTLLPALEFTVNKKEALLLSIMLHDAFKYGSGKEEVLNADHTQQEHDTFVAELVWEYKRELISLLGEDAAHSLRETLEMHHGRWSTYLKGSSVVGIIHNLKVITLVVHLLDMLSSSNKLK